MDAETADGPGANDSVCWRGRGGDLVWGLVTELGQDGTLTVRSGVFGKRQVIGASQVIRWERGGERYHRQFSGARDSSHRRR